MVTFVAYDNWMEFTVRHVVDYKRRRWAKDLLFGRILDEIDVTDGRVSLASASHHLVDAPEFRVRVGDPPRITEPDATGLSNSRRA